MNAHSPDGTAFEDAGRGPAVALVHGLGLTRAMWQWQKPALSPRFRVLSYDLFGHGQSPAPPRTPDLALFADQLLRLMDHRGLDRAAVVGFSLGGMIARRFAMDHPDRVWAMVVLNSPHDRSEEERDAVRARVRQARAEGPSATAAAALERWFTADFLTGNPDMAARVREWILANDAGIYPEIYGVLAEGDAELVGELHRIACPALVMTGSEDLGNSPRMAAAMAAEIPDARVVILPGLKHMALAEAPESVNVPLVTFLRETLDR